MARWTPERKRKARVKAGFSAYYIVFLVFIYGPMIAMFILSFQGRRGGTSFPMRGVSLHWWATLIEPSTVGDLQGAMARSLILALIVMVITALFSTMLAMAFRKPFPGSGALFYTVMAGLMVPGILLSLGLATLLKQLGLSPAWYSSALCPVRPRTRMSGYRTSKISRATSTPGRSTCGFCSTGTFPAATWIP